MKKILFGMLILLSLNSFAMKYEDVLKENKKIKQFETVNGVEFGKTMSVKKLQALNMSLIKTDPESKISFYKDVHIKPFFGVKVTDITYLMKDDKFISFAVEFEGEENFKKIEKNLEKKLGKPLLVTQNNEHITYAWGVTYGHENNKRKKLVRPLVLNFDIYEQMGVAIWTDPKIEFEQSNR